MTIADYQPFVDRMIELYEGGYGWDAGDPGGPTKYGITCYDLAEYLGQAMNSMATWAPRVKAMTLGTAEIIYSNKYASVVQFDQLNAGCDCAVFDFAVNSGPATAIKCAQRLISPHIAVDGILGAITLMGINHFDPSAFVDNLCDARMTFLKSLGIWSTFGRGWTNRVNDLRAYCHKLIAAPVADDLIGLHQKKLLRISDAYGKGWVS